MTYAAKARAHALAELESRGLVFGCVQDAIDAGKLTEREWQDLLDHYRGKPAGSGKPTAYAAVHLIKWARRHTRQPAP